MLYGSRFSNPKLAMGGKKTLLASCLSWSVVTARSSGTKMMTDDISIHKSISILLISTHFNSALPVALSGKLVQTWESSFEHGEVPPMLLCTREKGQSFSTSMALSHQCSKAVFAHVAKLVSASLFQQGCPRCGWSLGFFPWVFFCGFVVLLLSPLDVGVHGFYTIGLTGQSGDHQCKTSTGTFELREVL